jgi:lipopolysaccharide/colanic/teichoic acid biosynthesis glycosyltransferase
VLFSCASGARFIGELVEFMPVFLEEIKPAEMRKHSETAPLVMAVERQLTPAIECSWSARAKSILDFGLALVLLVLTAPITALAALAVKLTSRGPIFYCQTRTGHGGRPFTIVKLRTMKHNCESVSGACWSSKGDPRITWLGRLLRRTHVDELPQLWNVLRGEMSLVGPRPERPEFVVRLQQLFPDYVRRLVVRPGMSGLAQIQLPADTDVESVRRKLVYDLYYVDRHTLWLDVRIILSTIGKVLHLPFAVSRVLLQLPSGNVVEGDGNLNMVMDDKAERAHFMPASVPSVS